MEVIKLKDSVYKTKNTNNFNSVKHSAVYFMYNKEDTIIYIGKSSNGRLAQRMASHRNSSPFFKYVSYVKVVMFERDADCNIYEMYMIAKYLPEFNKDKPENFTSISLPEYEPELYYSKDTCLVKNREYKEESLSLIDFLRISQEFNLKIEDLMLWQSKFKIIKRQCKELTGVNIGMTFYYFIQQTLEGKTVTLI